MEILKEAALSWCSMPGCYSNPENFDEEIATNEKKEEGQLLPSFVHVPKAGGTLVESAGKRARRIGACNEKRPYEIAPGWDREVAPWHAQPKKMVKDSFAICRNPFDRFQSQFLYDPRWVKVTDRARSSRTTRKRRAKRSVSGPRIKWRIGQTWTIDYSAIKGLNSNQKVSMRAMKRLRMMTTRANFSQARWRRTRNQSRLRIRTIIRK